jgi:hypothetical protein
MDVWECIDVATNGSDGKPVVPADNKPKLRQSPRAHTVAQIVAGRLGKEQ